MEIEKDLLLNQLVVWLIDGSLMTEIYHSKRKRDCELFIKKEKRKKGK